MSGAAQEAGIDAAQDAGMDAARDAGMDAAQDAGMGEISGAAEAGGMDAETEKLLHSEDQAVEDDDTTVLSHKEAMEQFKDCLAELIVVSRGTRNVMTTNLVLSPSTPYIDNNQIHLLHGYTVWHSLQGDPLITGWHIHYRVIHSLQGDIFITLWHTNYMVTQ